MEELESGMLLNAGATGFANGLGAMKTSRSFETSRESERSFLEPQRAERSGYQTLGLGSLLPRSPGPA